MAILSYKSRGDSSPQGKPRVYFCCHEQDFALFFTEICEDILRTQNCAIWYHTGGERDAQFWNDLSQMQLFVMPVTSRLLIGKNTALDEFHFAVKQHIPVLPLMQEQGLDHLFNKVCGDLQFLDKSQREPTAIPYEEKLDSFLEGVLIGDELAEKIRAAFDVYVFLSYRKKDRKYAQELMRLIHKNDFCRDVAIWYDEFLTPGESFNEAIRHALEKSSLFLLAVTPNLVNETNYIMTTEYPLAREAEKPILPAEMVTTDKKKLSECFQGIPASTNAHDATALSHELLDKLCRYALRQNESAEHSFFIGLAYLGGVDVEVDYPKAVTLITEAAEAGFPEAINKLVEMFRTGLGVERNYELAVQWQEKYILAAGKAYHEYPCIASLDKLFWSILKCGDYYQELAQHKKAIDKYEQSLQILTEGPGTWTSQLQRNVAIAYSRLGGIWLIEGVPSKALPYYENALQLIKTLAQETNTQQAQQDLSICYDYMGDIYAAEGDILKARQYYEGALQLAQALLQKNGTIEIKRELSVSYLKIGDLCKAERDLTKAQHYYEMGLQLREELLLENDTILARRDLSVSYIRLADIYRAEGNLSMARQYYKKALQLREALRQEIGTLETYRDLSIIYERLGDLYTLEKNITKALYYFECDLEITKTIAQEIKTVESQQDLSVCYGKIGDFCMAVKNFPKARQYYEKSLKIREDLMLQIDTVVARRDLSVAYKRLGDLCQEEGDIIGARQYYEKMVQLSKSWVQETGTLQSWEDLAHSYIQLALLGSDREEYLRRAIAIYEKLCQACPGNQHYKKQLSILQSVLK